VRRALARLRWQLTLSHLIAIAFTLVSMVAALAVIAGMWWGAQGNVTQRPAEAARTVAQAITGLVEDVPADDLDAVLRVMASGRLQIVPSYGPPHGPFAGDSGLGTTITYVAVVNPSGQVLASSTPRGAAFAPPEQAEWAPLVRQALSNDRDLPSVQRSGDGPAALGAAPVVNGRGDPVGVVVVGVPSVPADDRPWLWPLAFFGVATIVVLALSFVFALLVSSIVGYLLSRRLVGRLEQLSQAAEALRGGDLTARVPLTGRDEVSQLQQSFNTMAGDLEHAMGDLAAERDRVSGLLEAHHQLVAGVSHELRTPVATVRGYLESALRRDGTLPRDLKSDLDTADREVVRLEALIDDLFTLSRAEVDRLELRPAPTDIGALVRGRVETQAPLAWRQRKVQLLAEVPPEGPIAQVDAQRVAQIVSNLLSNAIRHTPPGGLVAASVVAEPDVVRIEVCDTGEGIPPEALARLWERFYTGHDGAGAGLGLALVKQLTESMGGSVDVTSAPGDGSCFSIRLPSYHPGS
jgi:signal transduction histidine kinase